MKKKTGNSSSMTKTNKNNEEIISVSGDDDWDHFAIDASGDALLLPKTTSNSSSSSLKDPLLQDTTTTTGINQKKMIAELFNSIDINGDGSLDMEELAQALRRGKLPTSREQLEQLFYKMDIKKNGRIDLEEFTTFVLERSKQLHSAYQWILKHEESEMTYYPKHKKKKKKGYICAATLRSAAKKSGVHLSDKDVSTIMRKLDQDGDYHISYREFVDGLLLAPEINPRYFFDSWYVDAFTDDAESQFTLAREIRVTVEEEDDDDDSESTTTTTHKHKQKMSFAQMALKKLVCGGLAGTISRTLTAPIDRIRILMMTATSTTGGSGGSGSGAMGIRDAITLATTGGPGGYRRLWMGNGANCLKIAPEMGIKLMAFDMIKNYSGNDPTNVTLGERFIAGGCAGVIAQVTIYPMEVIKTRLSIVTSGQPLGIRQVIQQTLAEPNGYKAFYAGIGPSIVGILPYAAIDLSLNSILKEYAADYLQFKAKRETSVPLLLACGMISSGTAALLTFPLNTIRTRAQATGQPFGRVIKQLRLEGSWKAFYRGVVPCLAKVLPATSISYAAYEYLGGIWDNNNKLVRH